jgi:sensor histidine kinase YesM
LADFRYLDSQRRNRRLGVDLSIPAPSFISEAHLSGAHVGLGNVDDRMRSAFGADYGLVVDTAPGGGIKITLRVPKFRAGIRA